MIRLMRDLHGVAKMVFRESQIAIVIRQQAQTRLRVGEAEGPPALEIRVVVVRRVEGGLRDRDIVLAQCGHPEEVK